MQTKAVENKLHDLVVQYLNDHADFLSDLCSDHAKAGNYVDATQAMRSVEQINDVIRILEGLR